MQEPQTRQRPVFTQPLQNIDAIAEGQTAHFECRLIPVGDPTLKVEWFRNEKPLETSKMITLLDSFTCKDRFLLTLHSFLALDCITIVVCAISYVVD